MDCWVCGLMHGRNEISPVVIDGKIRLTRRSENNPIAISKFVVRASIVLLLLVD